MRAIHQKLRHSNLKISKKKWWHKEEMLLGAQLIAHNKKNNNANGNSANQYCVLFVVYVTVWSV